MDFTPAYNRIVVKRTSADTVTKGGLVLPETATEAPDHGIVLAVGPGKESRRGIVIKPDVNVGDKVLFSKGGVQSVTVNGMAVLIISEDDIFAVIEE